MSIIVSPLHDVEAIARIRRPSHILSLISPTAEPTGFARLAPHHLELRFNDITEPREGLIVPSKDHVQAILDFAKDAEGKGPLLIHCWAGVSRSPAAAYIVACQRKGASVTQIARLLRDTAPCCTPNIRMVSLADQALQAQGQMEAAIVSIARGQETMWGSPFELKS